MWNPLFFFVFLRFGIFPSWGLSQKLSRIIGANKAREVSLTSMPLTADVAEKLGFVNHVVVEEGETMKKARGIAQAIIKNEQGMVLRIKSVINDGIKLDLGHALTLEKVKPFLPLFYNNLTASLWSIRDRDNLKSQERAHAYYSGMTKEQFKKMQEFIAGRGSKKPSPKL